MVLENKLNITDQIELNKAEKKLTMYAITALKKQTNFADLF